MGGAKLDAEALREVMARFAAALREHRDELDSLNVYPVPDGDTGTNLLLTQEAVEGALEEATGGDLPAVAQTIPRASLLGARGNSGVILSQVLRGLCERIARDDAPDAATLSEALRAASDEARRAVGRPVEGTVLTVLADAAGAGEGALADGGADPASVARAAHGEARASVERTRDQLPELRAAGVVDAGGRGLLLLFDALDSVLSGRPMTEPVGPLGPVGREAAEAPRAPLDQRYEVQFLLEGAPDGELPALRSRLAELGDSLVVVGGGGTVKVHLHTNDPDAAVDVAEAAGRPTQVEVVDLEGQVAERCLAGQARAVALAAQRLAAVAVADGDGLAQIFHSLGAVVVPGGPGRNPPVGELLEAIEAAPASTVLVLPNHRNIVPAAERASAESSKEVVVVPTRSVPQGIAAAAALNPLDEPEEGIEAVRRAAEGSASGEVVRAVREAETPTGRVREGDWLAVAAASGEVVSTGPDAAAALTALVGHLLAEGHEMATLIVGAEAPSGEAESAAAAVREAAPHLELEVHRGGQASPPYLLGLE